MLIVYKSVDKRATACLQSSKFRCICVTADGVNGSYLNLCFRVVGGLETLDKMEKIKTDDKDRPLVRSHSAVHETETLVTSVTQHDITYILLSSGRRSWNIVSLTSHSLPCHYLSYPFSSFFFFSSIFLTSFFFRPYEESG